MKFFSLTRTDFGSAVCKVSPTVRHTTINNSKVLKIRALPCPVKDRIHIQQCRNCCRFGHTEKTCRANTSTCIFLLCASDHKQSDCPYKASTTKELLCSNCVSPKTAASDVCALSASDHTCPQYMLQVTPATQPHDLRQRPEVFITPTRMSLNNDY